MKLKEDEEKLIGGWIVEGSTVILDVNALRIQSLIDHHLIKVATDISSWDTLYKDTEDERLWELVYPESHLQGGGPPALIHLSEEEAKAKYESVS